MLRDRGFTLLELIVVLSVGAVIATLGTLGFSGYFERSAARQAAQIFAQDLVVARSFAIRSQEPVVIRFYETSRWYEVAGQSSATEIVRRRFAGGGEIDLSDLSLDIAGDSLVVDPRGTMDLSGSASALGTASFSSGAVTYTVSFNGMGASKIDQT